jgi:hypothetical protein
MQSIYIHKLQLLKPSVQNLSRMSWNDYWGSDSYRLDSRWTVASRRQDTALKRNLQSLPGIRKSYDANGQIQLLSLFMYSGGQNYSHQLSTKLSIVNFKQIVR